MSNYICRYNLVHDKKCKVIEDDGFLVKAPASNNGWIYSAYLNAVKKGGHKVSEAIFQACLKDGNQDRDYFVWRLPQKNEPPVSRDEVMGMISLGYNPLQYGWFMYRETRPVADHLFTYIKAIKVLISIREEHRNHFWENKIYDAYPVAMKLWWHDRYYIACKTKMRLMIWDWLFYQFMFNLYALLTIIKGTSGEKNILWLQLKDIKSKWIIKLLDPKKNFGDYFPEDHPVNKELQ